MAKIEMNGKTSRQPESKIPVLSPSPLRRSGSLRLGTCPPIQEHRSDLNLRSKLNRHRSLQSLNTASSFGCENDDDADSVKSFSSTASVCSSLSQCDHTPFARNGTTYSGRCKRYVVHCSPHSAETDDYLTPTQRTNRTIRKLRNLLKDAQEELMEKDREILRLTKEVVELRLLKVDSGTESNDIDGSGENAQDLSHTTNLRSTRSEPLTSSPHPRFCSSPPLAQSLSDSGHFEDLNSSKDIAHTAQAQGNQIKTLESLQRQHEDEIRELKERHNDKVDSLLQRITDVNDRYYALRPLYEDCKEKIQELKKLNEELKSNGSCNSHIVKIAELETTNEELSRVKETLEIEINCLKQVNGELELIKLNCDKLAEENVQLKDREGELMKALNDLKEENVNFCKMNGASTDESSQTEDLNSQRLCNGHSDVLYHQYDSCEQNNQCRYKMENSELKLQIVAHIEKIKQLEEQECSDKDIYVQLYKKGMQAAKLLDNKEIEHESIEERGSSLVPDLLQKLRIKQEELDNIQAMYRRLLETRKEQPKHDPEMTLQFLKSAFYYFLTDRENTQGHLSAIESILGFNDTEKINIEKAFLWR